MRKNKDVQINKELLFTYYRNSVKRYIKERFGFTNILDPEFQRRFNEFVYPTDFLIDRLRDFNIYFTKIITNEAIYTKVELVIENDKMKITYIENSDLTKVLSCYTKIEFKGNNKNYVCKKPYFVRPILIRDLIDIVNTFYNEYEEMLSEDQLNKCQLNECQLKGN